jgi:hypothetical protein
MGAVVTGWESPELEEEFYNWNPKANLSGRDTYHIQKLSIIVAILNGHSKITRADWEFCKAFMAWQTEIRRTFSTGSAKRVTQGEFNETVMDELIKRTKRLMLTGKADKHGKIKMNEAGTPAYYIRWKQPANSNRWYRYGMDVERTVDTLTRNGDLQYLEEIEEKGGKEVVVKNNAWVRVTNMQE